LDIGTSGCKGLLLDGDGWILGRARRSYRLDLPGPDLVELPPVRVWRAMVGTVRALAAAAVRAGCPIRAIAISASGDEVVMVDDRAHAVGPVIMALDGRSAATAESVRQRFGADPLYQRSGLPAHGIEPLIRLLWLREHEPATFARVSRVLAWPEFIAERLGLDPHADPSLASRTLAFDIRADGYDASLLTELGLETALFSPIAPAGTILGELGDAGRLAGLEPTVVLVAGGFDQAMALVGTGSARPGHAHLGIGSWEAVTVPLETPCTTSGLRTSGWTVGRSIDVGPPWIAMASLLAGAAIEWLDGLRLPGTGRCSRSRLRRPAARTGPLATAHLAGAYAPWLDPGARGAVVGLELGSDLAGVRGAFMESTCLDLAVALAALDREGVRVTTLRASGGGARSRAWLQLHADATRRVVERLAVHDAGALTAAAVAGAAIGQLPGPAATVERTNPVVARYEPSTANATSWTERAEQHRELVAAMQRFRVA
jgi:xylulokinase